MPDYINIARKGTSYSQGKLYKRGQVATLDKDYAEKNENVWKLLSVYNKEQEAARETNALRETPKEQVERLKKELKAAQAANAKISKAKEATPNLVEPKVETKVEPKKEENKGAK